MLAELVAEHGGVEPVERQLPPIHQFDEAFEHLGFLANLVSEAELLVAFDKAERLHRRGALLVGFLLLHRFHSPARASLAGPFMLRRSSPTSGAALPNSSADSARHITFNPIKAGGITTLSTSGSPTTARSARNKRTRNIGPCSRSIPFRPGVRPDRAGRRRKRRCGRGRC